MRAVIPGQTWSGADVEDTNNVQLHAVRLCIYAYYTCTDVRAEERGRSELLSQLCTHQDTAAGRGYFKAAVLLKYNKLATATMTCENVISDSL